jgi:predicted nucleic acid-binding protein
LAGVFVDTVAWYGLADPGDGFHRDAVRRFEHLETEGREFITSNHVVGETYTLLRARLGSEPAQRFLLRSRDPAYMTRVFAPEAWEIAAEALLLQYRDQGFSYVDAVSFVTMRRLGLQEAFSYDHHFATAGFTLL